MNIGAQLAFRAQDRKNGTTVAHRRRYIIEAATLPALESWARKEAAQVEMLFSQAGANANSRGVEDIFFVGGPPREGAFVGFNSLPFIRDMEQAVTYRDRRSPGPDPDHNGWWLVNSLLWVSGPDSFAVEAGMLLRDREYESTSDFVDRLNLLEQAPQFAQRLSQAIGGITPDLIETVGSVEIIPVTGDPTAGDAFETWDEPEDPNAPYEPPDLRSAWDQIVATDDNTPDPE